MDDEDDDIGSDIGGDTSATCATLAAVQSGTALAADLATTLPADALSALGQLTSTLSEAEATATQAADQALADAMGTALSALSGATSALTGAASALGGQISSQISNLTNNIQIFSAFSDLQSSTCPGTVSNLAADTSAFFGSLTMTAAIASIIARRLDRISTGEAITMDTAPTINDECSQIAGYATQLSTQATTEPAAFAAATLALTQYAEASVLTNFLQVPSILPILSIAAGTGFAPIVAAAQANTAATLGYAAPGDYSNVAVAPGEVPSVLDADPVPPPP